MMKLMATAAILVCAAGQAAWAEEGQAAQPSELTSRGVIAAAATEAYKEAIDSCPGIEPGSAPQGPKFVACLKRKLRSENETLVKTLNATASFLKPMPDRAARLRNAQGAWIKFRDENCGFARLVAPQGEADAFYYDCLLRVTIGRRVELRSLVGD